MQNILYNKAYNIDNLFLNFRSFFADLVKEASIESKILVVPTAKYARHLRQIYIRQHFELHSKPCSEINIMNFDSFVKFLFERIDKEASKTLISSAYRFLLIENAIRNSNSDYFKQSSGKVKLSLAKKLDSLIIGLKKKGITAQKIQKELSVPDMTDTEIRNLKKYSEISAIYSNYQESLSEHLLDEVDVLKYIIQSVEGSDSSEDDIFEKIDIPIKHNNPIDNFVPEINEIIFYGFSDFTLPEQRLLSLFTHSNKIQVAIYLENIKTDTNYNLPDISTRFTSYGFSKYNQSDLFEEDELNKTLKSSLFIKNTGEKNIIDTDNPPFFLLNNDNTSQEIENISRFVSYLIREKGIPPNKIALVTREAGTYAKPMRDSFLKYQIPLNISDRFELQTSTIVSTVLNILDTVVYGYKLSNLEKVFASYYMQHLDIDFSLIRKYALKLRITGGHKRGGFKSWLNRIASYKTYLSAKLRDNDFFEDELERYSYQKEQNDIVKVEQELLKIKEMFPEVGKKISAHDFINLIRSIIKDVKFEAQIAEDNATLQKSNYNTKYVKESIQDSIEKDGRALSAMEELLNELSYLNRSDDSRYSPIEHIDKLKVLVSGSKFQIREKEQYGVTLTSIEQTRGLPYNYVIMCGAVEGKFPLPFKTNTLLGKELPQSNLYHIEKERNLLYALLTGNLADGFSKGRKVVISYSQTDDDNDFARSHFIDELLSTLSIDSEESIYLQKHFDFENHDIYFKHFHADKYINSRDVYLNLKDDTAHQTKFSKPFAPTTFERYTDCPFRFMLQKVASIDEYDTDDAMLTPLEKGSLLHKILYRFYKDLAKDEHHLVEVAKYKNNNLLYGVKLDSTKFSYYLDTLKKIAEEEIEKYSFDHPLFHVEKEKILGNNNFKGLLALWLENELNYFNSDSKLYPVFFEYAFGNTKENELHISKDVKIKGKIDRIELSPTSKYFAIADYKSNAKNQYSDDVGEFTKFQMPLYSFAFSNFIASEIEEEFLHLHGIYYSLNPEEQWNKKVLYSLEDGENFSGKKPRKSSKISESHQDLEDRIGEYVDKAKEIVENIREGNFNVDPNLKHSFCKNCDYKQVCRIRKFEYKLP